MVFLVSFCRHSAMVFQFCLFFHDFFAFLSTCLPLLTPPSLAACAGHPLLDLDKPLCHLGVTALLRRLLPALGRDYLVRILKPHLAPTAHTPVMEGPRCTFCTAYSLLPWSASSCRNPCVPGVTVHFRSSSRQVVHSV